MPKNKINAIAAATAILFAALALPMAGCAKKEKVQGAQQGVSASKTETVAPDSEGGAAVADTAMPQATLPALKIDGKENPDVYLQSLDILVEVTGNIAVTRYTMDFKNKTGRVLEGELTFPLPDGRSVTHYALDINGKMRDAVPVEKERATQVFEEIERRQVDPGLLERVEGNNFRTRIYPIPANGMRTISIGYEEELALEKGLLYYRLPMAYPDTLNNFAVKATVWSGERKPLVPASEEELRFDKAGENYVASLARKNYKPARSLIFALPAPADIPQVMMQPAQGSYYFLASVATALDSRKKRWDDNLAIIWDVSLSGSQRDLRRELELLDMLFTDKRDVNVNLYFLNNRLKKMSDGRYKVANGDWSELKAALNAAVFDGGTDFSQINLKNIAGNEILFFSDGLSTLSDANFLKNSGLKRPVHCIVSSPKADYSAMKLIAGKTRGKFVNINALSSEQLKGELLNETVQFLGAERRGNAISEVYPSIASPVRGNFSIAGISGASDAELALLFGFGSKVEKKITVRLNAKDAAIHGNVYKIWAQKKIAELDLNYEANRAELTGLGAQFGIVTRNTSLIVLETVEDYARYNIEPPDELQAEYQKRVKERAKQAEREREAERNMMIDEAVESAERIKEWWNADVTPKKPKYPIPEERDMRNGSKATDIDALLSSLRSGSDAPQSRDGRIELHRGRGVANRDSMLSSAGGLRSGSDAPQSRNGSSATDVDAISSSIGGLRSDGIGFGSGVGSGFGGGGSGSADGIDGLLKAFTGGSGGLNFRFRCGERLSEPIVAIKPIKKDNNYLNKLTGKTSDDYQIYLKLRDDYAGSPTFYFDMADWFYTHKDKETALRILTSIADLELENASLYRLLGYRFKEYGEFALEKFVCKKVMQWRPMEPQSYRDYALALADNGEAQAALDSLYALLTKSYSADISESSNGIEEVVIMEINRLIAKNAKLNASKIDKRLITNVPVDVRVVINWNMNNADIDLYVKDPLNEVCSYDNSDTKIGGHMSFDNTDGYGPEQFILKKAVKGKYRVYVNYYGARPFTASGPSTVMVEIFTKYAHSSAERRRVVCFQLPNTKKPIKEAKVEVAEFEF
ncbi:MAG: DUF2135 domain-containing protein [Chitinispirillales bacterium]|jgi:hypothetical protein|nr:DUF2135 domain-containing protein [Chitinispirillales bacterium]